MKTLKIKKKRKKRWHEVTLDYGFFKNVERRDYIIQMTEEEYFEYIRWKGEENEKRNP